MCQTMADTIGLFSFNYLHLEIGQFSYFLGGYIDIDIDNIDIHFYISCHLFLSFFTERTDA